MSKPKLPSSTTAQQAIIATLVKPPCCQSSDGIIEVERMGLTAPGYFDHPESIYLDEIKRADIEMRPFDLVSLCTQLENTRNGDGAALSNRLTDFCGRDKNPLGDHFNSEGARAIIRDYGKMLIETKARKDALLLGQELSQAAVSAGTRYEEILEKIREIGQTGEAKGLPRIVSAADLCAKPPPTPPELIQGILHRGSKLVLGGGSKSFKTWTLLELAISVASGREWLGFQTAQGRVLYLNFELPEFSIQQRIDEICNATDIGVPKNLSLWNLRGYAASAEVILPRIARQAAKEDYGLIVLDPLYKLQGEREENATHHMLAIMNAIENVTVTTGAAVAFGSHYSKGNQAGKESMDRISGSGVFARDPDSILTMTRHEQDDAFTVEMTLRNFPPQEPFVVRRQHPLMVIDGRLDPAKLKQVGGRKQEVSDDDVLATLGDEALSYKQWRAKAEESLLISVDTFKRRLRTLKSSKRVRESSTEEGKYVRA